MKWVRLFSLLCLGFVVLTAPRQATAQLAPTGGHYAARPSDTGFSGAVNSQGAYGASVPLDLPKARGNLPVPLRISYGGNRVGAAGVGWDVPLSFIRRDTTIAHRRPANNPDTIPPVDASPRAREQLSLTLDGERKDLVLNAAGTAWLARRNDAQLEVRTHGDGVMVMYDGEGRTYSFSSEGGAASSRLDGGNLYVLRNITDPSGNTVHLEYQFGAPTLPGNITGLSIDLVSVSYNQSPTAKCYKHRILLNYDSAATSPTGSPPPPPLALSMLGSTVLARVHKVTTIDVHSKPSCPQHEMSLRTYKFTYQTDPDTQRPQLQKVTMIGQQDTPERIVTIPVAEYTYGTVTGSDGKLSYRKTERIFPLPSSTSAGAPEATFGISLTRQTTAEGPILATMQNLLDINGDGRPDLVWGSYASLNTPLPGGRTFFSAPFLFGGPSPNSTFSEKGALDIPRQVFHRIGADPNNPDHPEDQPPTYHEIWEQTIDLNGDGRLDFITADEVGALGYWVVYWNTPSGFVRQLIPIAQSVSISKRQGITLSYCATETMSCHWDALLLRAILCITSAGSGIRIQLEQSAGS
jgi:hypothetical protein